MFGMAAFAPALAQSISAGNANTGSDDGSATPANGSAGGTMDTLIVLGTAQKNTTALSSTAPVDVITPEQLAQTGAVTINEALSRLNPSFNFPQGQNAVKGQGVRAATLRGVGPAYTLILVNGKRRNSSALLAPERSISSRVYILTGEAEAPPERGIPADKCDAITKC